MKIQLITPEQHEILNTIYLSFPALTLQNKGFEGINRRDLTQEEKEADKKVNEILKSSIIGFSRFQNFKLSKSDDIQLRFQYNYNYNPNDGIPFIGVGYILLDELLNGFKN